MAKNAGIAQGTVFTSNGTALIAIPKHYAPSPSDDIPSSTNVCGDVIDFGKESCSNIPVDERHEVSYREGLGSTPEERSLQVRLQGPLDGYRDSGSARCSFESLHPCLYGHMKILDPDAEQILHIFTPTPKFVNDLVYTFTTHVPGSNENVNVVGLIEPFLKSEHWIVTAIVLGPCVPSDIHDFERVSSAAILLINTDGVVLVPFTATNSSMRLQGVAHFHMNLFICMRNYFSSVDHIPLT